MGPFKSVSPLERPPTPNQYIQDFWAQPAGLLGPGWGWGHRRREDSQPKCRKHFPLQPSRREGPARLGVQFPRNEEASTVLSTAHPKCSEGLASSSHLPPPVQAASPQCELEEQAQADRKGGGSGAVNLATGWVLRGNVVLPASEFLTVYGSVSQPCVGFWGRGGLLIHREWRRWLWE